MIEFPSPHSYDRILDATQAIFNKFSINPSTIYMFLHDSAGNFKKAFPNHEYYSDNCANHLLENAIDDAFKANQTMKAIIDILKGLVGHFHHSTISAQLLKSTQIKLGLPVQKLIMPGDTR
jgi:hypothetical protein